MKDKKQRMTIFMNHSVIKYAKTQAIMRELSLGNLVEKALINYLPEEPIIKKI